MCFLQMYRSCVIVTCNHTIPFYRVTASVVPDMFHWSGGLAS